MMYDDLQPQFDVLKKQIEILTITLTQKVMEPQIYHEYQSNREGYPDSRAYQNQEQHNMYLYLPPYYNLPYPPAQPGSPYIAPYYLPPLAYGQSLPYPPLQPAPVQDYGQHFETDVMSEVSASNLQLEYQPPVPAISTVLTQIEIEDSIPLVPYAMPTSNKSQEIKKRHLKKNLKVDVNKM